MFKFPSHVSRLVVIVVTIAGLTALAVAILGAVITFSPQATAAPQFPLSATQIAPFSDNVDPGAQLDKSDTLQRCGDDLAMAPELMQRQLDFMSDHTGQFVPDPDGGIRLQLSDNVWIVYLDNCTFLVFQIADSGDVVFFDADTNGGGELPNEWYDADQPCIGYEPPAEVTDADGNLVLSASCIVPDAMA